MINQTSPFVPSFVKEGIQGRSENILAAANFVNKTNTDEVIELIREAGFVPTQRTTLYEILRVYEEVEAAKR